MSYSAWVITESDRTRLLNAIPTVFPDVIAHHVTLKHPSKTPPPAADIWIMGQIIDPTGVQVLIVMVETQGALGTIRRPDEQVYHITWSIDRSAGKKPVSSLDTIERLFVAPTYVAFPEPIKIATTPEVCG